MTNKGKQTRRNIIEKSMQLFSVKGYYNTSINDILEVTELTKGGLYGHFKSKEEIWYAVYDEAVTIWRGIVFHGLRTVENPLERVELVIDRIMRDYLAANIFDGGCFFLNMLVEMSGQSESMRRHILRGYVRFSRLMRNWLREAGELGMLKPGLNYRDVASFIVIALNGAFAIYTASRDSEIWRQTIEQLKLYIGQLRN
ncbi:TetR/AcrR family transcriptional regulator [Desulfogranum japonicum]|uniref:TetR/AcrR family transcriptional regulator n=1 Tax=Desulfogranum japonicum TaxID=231447 RepID=UPI000410D84C|nr:TetR/AcrR family transcriptional regulator [Desulfogranum japonicum]